MKTQVYLLTILLLALNFIGCSEESDDSSSASSTPAPAPEVVTPKYLYVTTGACYSGNGMTAFTTATASNQVYRLNLSTGAKDTLIADYFASPSNSGDSPVSIQDYDEDRILVLVENATAGLRRIELVEKSHLGSRSIFTNNATALSGVGRQMRKLTDGFLLVSKTTAVEKIGSGTNRLTAGANPWINLTGSGNSCLPSATIVSSILQLPGGMLAFTHAATGAARVGVVSSTGYNVTGDCKDAEVAPSTGFPTAMAYDDDNNQLIVAFGGHSVSTNINTIYAYTVDESTGALSSPQQLYEWSGDYSLYGISSMTLDSENNKLYVATTISNVATAVNYRIERFSYNGSQVGVTNSAVLTKDSSPFYNYGFDTRCVSDMMIAE